MSDLLLRGPPISYNINKCSVGEFFFDKAEEYGTKLYQLDPVTDETETFAEFKKRATRTALELKNRGITSTDMIVFCSKNTMDCTVPLIGATFLGAKVTSLDVSLSVTNVSQLLQRLTPKMIFVQDLALDLIEKSVKQAGLPVEIVVMGQESRKYAHLNEFLTEKHGENEFRPVETDIKDTAFIFFSSGTTATPKAICLSHENLLNNVNIYIYYMEECQVFLNYTSLYWISAAFMLLSSFFHGACKIVVNEFDAENTLKIIEKCKVTTMALGSGYTYKFTNLPNFGDYNLSSLTNFYTGGSGLSRQQLQKTSDCFSGANLIFCYAMTETNFITDFDPKKQPNAQVVEAKLGSCGKPLPGVTLKIVDLENDKVLGPNCDGEIRCKTSTLMRGYYNEDSSQAFDQEGYLKTGDVGHYDSDGYLYIVGRCKEMFKYQIWHIVPSVLETILEEFPAVYEAVIFGVPHIEDGEIVAAWVVLKANTTATVEEIEKFYNERVLDREKLRGGLQIVEEIPKTLSGKIQRNAVREMAIKSNYHVYREP